jgi:hypothetical protein
MPSPHHQKPEQYICYSTAPPTSTLYTMATPLLNTTELIAPSMLKNIQEIAKKVHHDKALTITQL